MRKAKVVHLPSNRKDEGLSDLGFEELFKHVQDGVLIVNSLGLIEYINPAYEKIFGVSNFAMKGKSIYRTLNDDVILNSIKKQKNIHGYINIPNESKKYSVTSNLFLQDNKYRGIIAIYREDSTSEYISSRSYVNKERSPKTAKAFEGIIGRGKLIQEVLNIAEKAARSNATVLISGETGTGKGVIAEAIHNASTQSCKPFVKVNCGAIPYNLLESELFGHEQGAFTGAVKRKIGKFEQAHGGTIFLDEIGDMPMDMQVKVLRVIQDKEFERVGGIESIKCDVRIIAATHYNLEELIEKGLFREDLFYRLNVIPIYVPALKERKEDIIDLSYHYMKKICKTIGGKPKVLYKDVEEAFACYHWPGNIRELKNIIERLIILVDDEIIRLEDLPTEISKTYAVNYDMYQNHSLITTNINGEMATLDDYEKEIIQQAIRRFGSFNKAAKSLGITHKTVAAKARKYKIIE